MKHSAKKSNAKKKVKENFEAQIERQWKLIKLLSDSINGLTRKELAKELQVDERTISRDLAIFRKVDVAFDEIIGERGQKRWSSGGKKFAQFTHDEAAALYIGRRFLSPLAKTEIGEAADRALNKIQNQLGISPPVNSLLEAFGTTDTTGGHCELLAEKADIVNQLIHGYQDCCEVTISYQSLQVDEPETYNFRPYLIDLKNNTIYITGYSLKSKAVRHLKLNRMISAESTKEKFVRPPQFESQPFFATPPESQKVTILFEQAVARYVQESNQYKPQHIIKQADGSIIVDYQLSETELFKRWLLGFGSHAELLEPKSLRTEIQEEVERLRKCYARKNRQ